uniref:LIM zinc-binding domain-containing protein n=1 Tax=Globodera pallida TaxID=36090 RepID=A0A183CEM8_GLOPA
MNFGSGPTKKFCQICRTSIEIFDEKVQVEKFTMHKSCFICAICDCPLQPGSCSRDDGLMYMQFMAGHRIPLWFCSAHMHLGSGEKYELLKKRHQQYQQQQQQQQQQHG